MQEFDVVTDMNPEEVNILAAIVFRELLAFYLGGFSIGGKTLEHPSGRAAAALSWKRTGEHSVAIIADENAAPEIGWIEEGRKGADMKAAMLMGGKVGKDGYRSRVIPIRKDGFVSKGAESATVVRNGGRGEKLSARNTRMWAVPRPHVNAQAYATMSNRPGAAAWQIPDMPGYSPIKIMSDLLRQQIGK